MSATGRGAERVPYDAYDTPSWCTRLFLHSVHLPEGRWLEPCAGTGALIRAALEVKPSVQWDAIEIREECHRELALAPARVAGTDFLACATGRYDVVITNPPYSIAQAVIEQAMQMAPVVVMLLRLNFVASEARASFMRKSTPDIYVLPNRPSFTGGGTDATEYAWYVWRPPARATGRITVLPTVSLEERRGHVLSQGDRKTHDGRNASRRNGGVHVVGGERGAGELPVK